MAGGRLKPTEDVMQQANMQLHAAEGLRKKLHKHFMEEARVPMYLSPMYQAYFGKVMQVSINGISIFFPVNGSTYTIPQSFADEIAGRRMQVDAILNKQRRMANIPANIESSPGELQLF